MEDWKSLPNTITPHVEEVSGLIGEDDTGPFREALSTLSPPEMLLKDLIEEMAVKGESDSQTTYLEKITESLFSKNSLSDVRNSFAVKHKQSWTAVVGKLGKVLIESVKREGKKLNSHSASSFHLTMDIYII